MSPSAYLVVIPKKKEEIWKKKLKEKRSKKKRKGLKNSNKRAVIRSSSQNQVYSKSIRISELFFAIKNSIDYSKFAI
ncbi:hypothetical protein FXV91_02840 [Methanosarcina sp. DH2]|uniref:hypothetical protein n=1 Tax=Methanosarcina sp. DH2 TaxID=2605639 RepID=UPI001E56EAE1|nr:hypothetical protein [Methanosarcina sp. DH2]MCC4769180.1 hypothetical protein [Methanosarcina sp. DH2]